MSVSKAIRRLFPRRKALRHVSLIALTVLSLVRVDSIQWWPFLDPVWTRYTTPLGGIERVVLQDATSVDLNTDSAIDARFLAAKREVVLRRGEAFFAVAHDTNWPFSVAAGGSTISAVGARFSVRLHDDDQVDVLVTEGRAVIRGRQLNSGIALAGSQTSSSYTLTASSGDSVSLLANSVPSLHKVSTATLMRKTAWTDGWLWFSKDPLPEAVAQFNRYHREKVVLVDPALTRLEVGGRFQSADLDSFIDTLKRSFNVRATSSPVPGTNASFIYLTERCKRAKQQCNWSMVQ
jgi:transmembrane sensor